jgi:hypothetical protein
MVLQIALVVQAHVQSICSVLYLTHIFKHPLIFCTSSAYSPAILDTLYMEAASELDHLSYSK